jgi:acetolactate synthase-1/2/3 large subunit
MATQHDRLRRHSRISLTPEEAMNAAVSMLETAAASGVELCLANPGTTEMPLVTALDRVDGIRAVLCLFEGVCTGAADGYGRMTGRPALTLLHLGPGFANGIANLHNARRAHTPVVNLIGDQASWHLAFDAPLTSDIESLARPVSGFLRSAESAKSLPLDMAEAITAARSAPGGVATLVLPADFQAGEADDPVVAEPPEPAFAPDEQAITNAARLLERCRETDGARATILLGGAALGERGLRAAGRVAAAGGARLVTETFPARWERGAGLPAPERLPYLPEQASAFLKEDVALILAGARSPVAFFGYAGLPSEIAADVERLALAAPGADSVLALEALADAIGAPASARAVNVGARPTPGPSGALEPRGIGATLAARLPEGAIVVDEAATSSLGFYEHSAQSARHSVLTLTGGAIGQGMPCATGAALACPDRPVVSFQADGSAMYTFQSLWTQAREGLNVTTVLCSNRAYRILQIELARAGVSEPGAKARSLTTLDQPELDWVSLARGCGVAGKRVETGEAFDTALVEALATPGPQLIEVML